MIELPMAPAEAPPASGRRFHVDGMDCAGCARTVEKAVAGLEGVRAARVSFGTATMLVEGDAEDRRIVRAVTRAGYRARPDGEAARRWDARSLSAVAAAAVLAMAVIAALIGAPRAVAEPLYLAALAIGGWPVAIAAATALRGRSLDMNVLMALAAAGAVGIGDYAEGAWVLVLFSIGTSLEQLALNRSRRSVEGLMELVPDEAHVLRAGGERTVPVAEVVAGEHVLVRPGERVPLDGAIVEGRSALDEAALTGESMPVDKEPGDTALAGTVNGFGALTVRVAPGETTLARVTRLVADAQASRAPSERLIDRFARIYTPLVFAAAALVALIPILAGGDADTWLYRALALLIVACPCALVISVPVAVVSAIGGAARGGVLIKGGEALEALGRVRTVALDKTGTLTVGEPRLTGVEPLDGVGEDAALALVAAVERGSEHPLGRALVRAAEERGLEIPEAHGFEADPGRGGRATVAGRELWVRGAADATVELGEGGRALARFSLADEPRADAAAAVAALGHVVMLTGDAEPAARAVAERTGVREWRSGLLPEDKLEAIRGLPGPVAMVGDGINDAPALAAADVGIAMGAAGTDVALETADVALMADELSRLPDALAHGRRTLAVIRQNVIAALAVKAVFVVLAPLGLATLVMAVVADMGMSLLVTLNALRLLRMAGS